MEQTNENSKWVWLVWESESHSCSKGCKGLQSNANSVLLGFLAHVLVARVTAWWIHVHCIVFQVRTVQWKNRVMLWCWCSSCDTMPYGQQCCVWECVCPVLQNNLLAAWSKSLVLSSTHLVLHSHTALMLYSLAETTAPGNIPADNKCWENIRLRGIHLFGTNSCAQETPNRISTKANKGLWLVDILQKKNRLWSNIFHWLSRPLYCW